MHQNPDFGLFKFYLLSYTKYEPLISSITLVPYVSGIKYQNPYLLVYLYYIHPLFNH